MCSVSEQNPASVSRDCASTEDNGTDDTIYLQSIKTQKRRIKMYKCDYCGKTFEYPRIKTYKESREFWGMTCYEEIDVATCPFCGDEDFEEYEEEDELC